MAFPQLRHLANNVTQTNDNTVYPLQLPYSGYLHTLLVKFQATNGATSNRGVHILSAVSLIEVLGETSEVLFSMSAVEIEKWYETEFGVALSEVWNETAAAVQSITLPIMFGRKYFDPEYFLNLSSFKDIYLRITYNTPISATVGFATGTTVIDVQALITPKEIALQYAGTLVTKRIKDFTSLASGDDETDLSRTAVFRNIGIYVYEAGVEDGTNVTRVQLAANDKAFNLLDSTWQDLINFNQAFNQAFIQRDGIVFVLDEQTIDTRLGKIKSAIIQHKYDQNTPTDAFVVANIRLVAGDRLTNSSGVVDVTAGAETYTADATGRAASLTVVGNSPSYFARIPGNYIDRAENWLRSSDYSRLQVILTQANAGAIVRISTQELKRY